MLHEGPAPGPATEPEDPRPVLPVLALRGESRPRPLGLLPRQGGQVCPAIPAARASVVSATTRATGPGSRSGAPDQRQGDAVPDAATAPAMDQSAQAKSGRQSG